MSLHDSISRRLALARSCQNDARKQAMALIVCQRDVVQWINDWVWTFDPRGTPSMLPFDLFPKQVEFVHWLIEREANQEDGLVEKCRDMGVTWITCAFMLHRWLFRDGFAGGMGSRKLEYVDAKGDPKCLFEKLRFMLKHLPTWQLPETYNENKHDNFKSLRNPDRGSSINGEGGDDIGRGGRTSMYMIDESAFLSNPLTVEASLEGNSNVKIHVSTYNGMNHFWRMVSGGKYPVFVFDWKDDPRKDQAWYDDKKAKLDPVTFAQEVDRDPTASVEGIAIPAAWVLAAVNFNSWLYSKEKRFLPSEGELIGGLDVAAGGKNKNVLTFRRGPIVDSVVSWDNMNTTESAYHAMRAANARQCPKMYYDGPGVGAGIKGTFDTKEDLGFEAIGVNTGMPPTNKRWPDGKSSKQKFKNFKAELWWTARVRFEKTYEYKVLGVDHPLEDLISIPQNEQLIRELSTVVIKDTDAGLIRMESKAEMKNRGIPSPDYADSLMLSLIDIPEIQGAL